MYVFANEGHKLQDKRSHLVRCPGAATRIDCQVRMGYKDLKLRRQTMQKLVSYTWASYSQSWWLT